MLVRTRVLEDLSRKRKAARVQLERLQAGRERLLESYDIVRRTLDDATSELRGSLVAAKQVADAAARRVEAEPTPTAEQLEAEVEAAADAGLPLVDDAETESEFEGELPEGEMVPIEPSAPFEAVRVVDSDAAVEADDAAEPDDGVEPDDSPESQPDPEPEAVEVVEVIEVVEIVEITDDDEADMTPGADVDVDDLFARIRAGRAGEVAKAREVLGDTPADSDVVTAEAEPAPKPESAATVPVDD